MIKGKSYWFPAKRRGWGWGLPNSWQGWAVFSIWFAGLAGANFALVPEHVYAFWGVVAASTVALLLVCYWKGEPPGWR